jgi:hypothetical protein
MESNKKDKDIGYDSRILDTYGKISEILDSDEDDKKPMKKEKSQK